MTWPVEINGLEYHPIPESWVEHGKDAGEPGKRLFAVSAALTPNGRMLRIRYGHPISGQVLLGQHGAEENPTGDGIVPAGLARGTGWSRCKTPAPDVHPVEPLRDLEWEHLQDLWADRLGFEQLDEVDRGRGTIADGGQTCATGPACHGVDPDDHLTDCRDELESIAANPMRSTVSSGEIADLLGLEKHQATHVLRRAEDRGWVDLWSAENHHTNPKWTVTIGGGR